MRKVLPRIATAWILLLTYTALFILLVISRNHQFWNQRKASTALVELIPKANERQSIFTDLYKASVDEQMAFLKLSYSGGNYNVKKLITIIPEIKAHDSLLAASEKLIEGSNEMELLKKLKALSSQEKKYEEEFLGKINEKKTADISTLYENTLSPIFTEFQKLTSKLLETANTRDKIIINDTRNEIIKISNTNLWISTGLVILLISLGINLLRIIKKGRSTTMALKASESKFRNFFNLAPIPIWVIDPESNKFMSVNKAACHLYGYTEEEFLEMTIFDIRRGENPSKEMAAVKKVKEETLTLAEDKAGKFNSDHSKKDGEKIEAEVYVSPIVIKDKKRMIGIVIDVTERNHFENKITKAIIKTQEDERYEIGSELHDNVCQILAAAKMRLGMIRPSLSTNVIEHFDQSTDAILLATTEIRNLSHRLAPAFFDNTKLEVAIESLLNSFNLDNRYKITINFDHCSKQIQIQQDIQLNLYRILQEQLRNIIEHANCTDIEVSVFVYNKKLHMKIADNGDGFDETVNHNGIGFANMKRRTKLFSGNLYLNSSKGNGCEVTVVVPLVKIKETEKMAIL